MQADLPPSPFETFWMAGFECSDQLNVHGDRVDLLEATAHLDLIREDYQRIKALGIRTVREGIRWSQVEQVPYEYHFAIVAEMMRAGREMGIQQIWDLCHFGYPDDLSPLHPHFTRRFVSLCQAFVHFYLVQNPGDFCFVTPINEVSFISWLGGDAAATTPYCRKNGWEVKYALMQAYIAGVRAMKQISSLVRVVSTEPVVNMVPPADASLEQILDAQVQQELQFQATDILCGKICPELGGSEDLLDIVGLNFYYNNQWIIHTDQFLGWNDPVPDPRWRPLSELLTMAYERYRKPFILSETSHPKEDRPIWIRMITAECAKVIDAGMPLWGVCWYPIIDRPDWDHLHMWHHAGIWDSDGMDPESRILHEASAHALLAGQLMLERRIVEGA